MRQHLPQALEPSVYALHAPSLVAVGDLPAHPLLVLVHHDAADAGVVIVVAGIASTTAANSATTSTVLGGNLAESVRVGEKKRQTLVGTARSTGI